MQLIKPNSLVYGMWVRSTVKRHTGIPTCAGITPTKTLVKLANRLARKRDTNGVLLLVWPPPVRNRRAGRGRGHPRGPRGGEVAPAGLGGAPRNGAARYASLCARCGAQHINQGGCPGGGLAGRGRAYASHCGRFASAVSPRRGPCAYALCSAAWNRPGKLTGLICFSCRPSAAPPVTHAHLGCAQCSIWPVAPAVGCHGRFLPGGGRPIAPAQLGRPLGLSLPALHHRMGRAVAAALCLMATGSSGGAAHGASARGLGR